MTAMVVLWICLGAPSGYISARLYKVCDSGDHCRQSLNLSFLKLMPNLFPFLLIYNNR